MSADRFSLVFFSSVLWLAVSAPVVGQPSTTCEELLREAEEMYVDGRFDRTIHLADECLRMDDLAPDDFIASYRLLALSYMRMDRLGDARMAVLHLLHEVPEYSPNSISDPPDYTVLVESVKSQFTSDGTSRGQRSWFATNSRWLIGGGAALAGGIIAAMLLQDGSSGGGGTQLPGPPEMPH